MAYSQEVIQLVWEKGKTVPDNDPEVWRKDECGAWMQRSMYADRSSQYGWEIDHSVPGGSDDIVNLCPLHWRNNVGKGDARLICKVTAHGVDNKEVCSGEESGGNAFGASVSRNENVDKVP